VPRFGRRQRESDAGAPGPAESDVAGRAFEEALAVARSDLAAVADELGVFDVDVHSPAAPADARDRYDEALRSFMLAGEQLERAQRPAELVAVGAALEQTRHELGRTRALLDGDDPPARTAPCLFDPRHGSSVAEVPWAPGRVVGGGGVGRGRGVGGAAGAAGAAGVRGVGGVGGAVAAAARPVPACAADAARLADGVAPDVRLVSLGGRPTPYWDVPVLYGPLLVGYYDRFGGAERLTELLRGTPLGDALASGT
jgi:hypothetical protein